MTRALTGYAAKATKKEPPQLAGARMSGLAHQLGNVPVPAV
jgi:hypothetical protein